MASIEKYQEFLSDIMSSSDISAENKKILFNVLNTSEMQANIPNESLKDLSESIKASATTTKISPAAILAEVTTIQQKAQKFEQSREANREGPNTNETTSKSDFMESLLAAYVTTEMVSQMQEKYPSLTQEEAAVFAASEAISDKFHKVATPKEVAAYDRATAKQAFTDKELDFMKDKTAALFQSDEKLSMEDFISRVISSSKSAAEFFKEFDLSTIEGSEKASRFFAEGCKSGAINAEDKIAYYTFLSQMDMYREAIGSNHAFISQEQAQAYLNRYNYETGKNIYAYAIEGLRHPESINNSQRAWANSLSKEELNKLAQASKGDLKEIMENPSTPDVAKLAKDQSDIIDEEIRIVREAIREFDNRKAYDIAETPVVGEFDVENYMETYGEEIPAKPSPQKDSYRAPNDEPADLSISPEEFMDEFEIESSTLHTPQESSEVTFDIDDFDFSNVAMVDESPSEEFVESAPEAAAVEHDPDAGLDALARGEKEVERKPEEVVTPPQPEQDVSYNWRDVLRGFINRITGKTKAISAPQKQQGQDESMPEPPKGNEVKKNDDSFFSRIAKALGMKKEEPQPITPETESKPEATIETSDVFSHVAVDVEKAVQQSEAQAKANKEDPNLKKKLNDPTQEQNY